MSLNLVTDKNHGCYFNSDIAPYVAEMLQKISAPLKIGQSYIILCLVEDKGCHLLTRTDAGKLEEISGGVILFNIGGVADERHIDNWRTGGSYNNYIWWSIIPATDQCRLRDIVEWAYLNYLIHKTI